MSSIETAYDYFEDHAKAAVTVNETRPIFFGALCFALGGASLFVSHSLSQRLVFLTFSWSSLLLTVLWQVASGFVLAAVLHLILDLQKIKGSATGLFVLLGMANLVWALEVPFVLLARMAVPESRWPATVIYLLVGFLVLNLKARSIRDNYRVSMSRAWFTLGLPYVALFAAAMLAVSLAFWIAFLRLMQWAN